MKKRLNTLLFVVVDFIASASAYAMFYRFRKDILGEVWEGIDQKLVLVSLLAGIFWICIFWAWGFYDRVHRRSRLKDALSLVPAVILGTTVLFFLLLLDDVGITSYKQYYKTFSLLLSIQLIYIFIAKIGVMSWLKYQLKKGNISYNAILVSTKGIAETLLKELNGSHRYLGLNFVGVVNANGKQIAKTDNIEEIGNLDTLEKCIRETGTEEVVIALERSDHNLLKDILDRLADLDVLISVTPDIYDILIGSVRVNQILGAPLIEVKQELMPQWQRLIKRFFDVVFSLLVLIIGSPFLIAVILLTKFTSEGPVFYTQERVGLKGRKFKIIKFRSMHVDAEKDGPALSSKNDTRVTKWGRFMRRTRIDEIPQFINVLKGEMALVGPRPERSFYIEKIIKQAPHYRHLHKVKPGITSLGQIKVGYAENIDQMVDRLKHDIIYMENMSNALDLRILFFTIFIILQGRGK